MYHRSVFIHCKNRYGLIAANLITLQTTQPLEIEINSYIFINENKFKLHNEIYISIPTFCNIRNVTVRFLLRVSSTE